MIKTSLENPNWYLCACACSWADISVWSPRPPHPLRQIRIGSTQSNAFIWLTPGPRGRQSNVGQNPGSTHTTNKTAWLHSIQRKISLKWPTTHQILKTPATDSTISLSFPKKDVFSLLPIGFGKCLIYQMPMEPVCSKMTCKSSFLCKFTPKLTLILCVKRDQMKR